MNVTIDKSLAGTCVTAPPSSHFLMATPYLLEHDLAKGNMELVGKAHGSRDLQRECTRDSCSRGRDWRIWQVKVARGSARTVQEKVG